MSIFMSQTLPIHIHILTHVECVFMSMFMCHTYPHAEKWGAGVKTQKMVRGENGEWGRVPFNETYAPSLSTIYDGA